MICQVAWVVIKASFLYTCGTHGTILPVQCGFGRIKTNSDGDYYSFVHFIFNIIHNYTFPHWIVLKCTIILLLWQESMFHTSKNLLLLSSYKFILVSHNYIFVIIIRKFKMVNKGQIDQALNLPYAHNHKPHSIHWQIIWIFKISSFLWFCEHTHNMYCLNVYRLHAASNYHIRTTISVITVTNKK